MNKFRLNYFGFFWGMIFLLGALVFTVLFVPPIFLAVFQKGVTGLFSYDEDHAGFERMSYLIDGIIYLAGALIFLTVVLLRKIPVTNKKTMLIIFYFLHFIFASGLVCWHQQYLKYKDFVGGEGQDLFPMHIAIVKIACWYPFIGILFDWLLKRPYFNTTTHS